MFCPALPGADRRRLAGGMISGLFILLVIPPLRGKSVAFFFFFFKFPSVAAKHLLRVGSSAASIQASVPERLLKLREAPTAG